VTRKQLSRESILTKKLTKPLMEDARRAMRGLGHRRASGYKKRMAFKAAFAAIEGMIFVRKQWALKRAKEANYSLSELALLREESYRLNHRGDVEVVQNFLRVPENLLFAWRMARAGTRSNRQIDLGGEGWRCLKESVKVRNRLTHPRSEKDLEVSGDEIDALLKCYVWVLENEFWTIADNLKRHRKSGAKHSA
jgi:hypothetical protein